MRAAQEPTSATLKPVKDESKDWDTTENIFIEGDNLEALKILQKYYHNKVKMIYIDPPYNTGKDFVYPDNFKEGLASYLEFTKQVDGEGKKISTNSDTNGRYHSNWLNMMYPRIKLARNLLKNDGVMFISIDDNEQSNLKKMCDEIFGEDNFVADAIWRSKDNSNNDAKKFSTDHNHTLVYSRNSDWQPARITNQAKQGHFKNPDNDPRGAYFDGNPLNSPNYRENLIYDLVSPQGNVISAPKNGWRWSKDVMNEKISSGEIRFTENGMNIKRRTYLEDTIGLPPSTLWIDLEITGHNRQATTFTDSRRYF
jgi:adenine-specific DNA-methyltransferase